MKLAENLVIDGIDYANQGNSFIGIRGSGKTYAAMKAAEQLMDIKIPIVAIDPTGVWQNLRNGINGHPGYPVIVVGGMHSDFPLEKEYAVQACSEIMEAALQTGASVIFDLKGMATSSKSLWAQIVVAVVQILLEQNEQHGLRHVFIEEAAEFVPQRVSPGGGVVYARIESLARMGRNFGLGYSLMNQRAEEVAKAIFEISEQVFIFRQSGKNSLRSIMDWLDFRGLKDQGISKTLPSLENGTCWVVNEKQELLCKILPKNTLHPNPKDRKALPEQVQEANRDSLIEKITLLIPEFTNGVKTAKALGAYEAGRAAAKVIEDSAKIITKLQAEVAEHIKEKEKLVTELRVLRSVVAAVRNALKVIDPGAYVQINMDAITKQFDTKQLLKELPDRIATVIGTELVNRSKKDRAPMRMLKALAIFPSGSSHSRMCLVAGVTMKSSTYRGAMAWLRSEEYIREENDKLIITRQGMLVAGPVETPGDLVRFWADKLGGAPARAILTLNKAYPHGYTKFQLAALINTSADSSTMRGVLAKLRKNKLITESGRNITLSNELKT